MRSRLLISSILFFTSILTYVLHAPDFMILSPLTFWIGVFTPLKIPFMRRKAFRITFYSYLTFHLLLYGFFYGFLLGYVHYVPVYEVYLGYAIPPKDWIYFLQWVSETPGLTLIIAGYEADIMPFTIFTGILLASLLAKNIQAYLELKRRKSPIIWMPLVSIISGTSCCTSLPSIIIYTIALATGTAIQVVHLLAEPLYFWFVWYGLPFIAIFMLWISARDVDKIIKIF